MKKSIYTKKNYIHFDRIKGIFESKKWIEMPENIMYHGFMPFIHFERKISSMQRQKGEKLKLDNSRKLSTDNGHSAPTALVFVDNIHILGHFGHRITLSNSYPNL